MCIRPPIFILFFTVPNNAGSVTKIFTVPNNAYPDTVAVPNNATLIIILTKGHKTESHIRCCIFRFAAFLAVTAAQEGHLSVRPSIRPSVNIV